MQETTDAVQDMDALRKDAEAGDAVAQNNLGICYYKGSGVEKDVAQAVTWWHRAAEQGHAEAQF